MERFKLDQAFLAKYATRKPSWGYGALSEITFLRTYSRLKEDGTKESWAETVKRVVEGCFNIQKEHIVNNFKRWDERKARRSAERMYDLIYNFKFTPPGRGLWAMGSPIITEKKLFAALNNCAFVSTSEVSPDDPTKPFRFLMDMSMLGVGVGFDVEGAGKIQVFKNEPCEYPFTIPDSREGWVESVQRQLEYYLLEGGCKPSFIYDKIRGKGEIIKGFGGIASGPDPLKYLHSQIDEIICGTPEEKLKSIVDGMNSLKFDIEDFDNQYQNYIKGNSNVDYEKLSPKMQGWFFSRTSTVFLSKINLDDKGNASYSIQESPKSLTITQITNLMNAIGACVVSGNVRRSAEIALGRETEEFTNLKNYSVNPERISLGWTSNNSILTEVGQSYSKIAKSILERGEPGCVWLENMRKFGRMGDPADYKDLRAMGVNPCSEQTLESYELCNLVEVHMNNIHNIEEFKDVLKFSYMYSKTVTLGMTNWMESNEVISRNRRIGNSLTGVVQFVDRYGLNTYVEFMEAGYNSIQKYDKIYSEWFGIPRSIKSTSIKPSGTISLLSGATPGIHWPKDICYFRTIRIGINDPLIPILREAGYRIEQDVVDPSAFVVYFPIFTPEIKRTEKEVSIWEKFLLVQLTQRHWADNLVSCTITYDEKTEATSIEPLLNYGQYALKSISFLPISNKVYPQMPYTSISKKEYDEAMSQLKPINFDSLTGALDSVMERGCDGDKCTI